MRELFEARVEGLRRARAEEAVRRGEPPPVEGDVEEEIRALADRDGIRRSWVAPPRARKSRSRTAYVIAAAIGIGFVGALGATRRR
jgi:hypothetical protein